MRGWTSVDIDSAVRAIYQQDGFLPETEGRVGQVQPR